MTPEPKTASILVVDDEPKLLELFQIALEKDGYQVVTAENGANAISIMKNSPAFDLIFTDLRMPGVDGMELFRWIAKNNPETPVVIVTAYGTVDTAVESLKAGAYDYLIKPVKLDELRQVARRVLEHHRVSEENRELKQTLRKQSAPALGIVGNSASMQEVYHRIEKVAPSAATVLILGESGTGKELVARAIHEMSPRKEQPFVKAVCAALPEGLLESELFGHVKGAFTGAIANRIGRFEAAHNGTIFLDEIGDIPLSIQIKLLRVLQERQFERVGDTETQTVDVRVIAATNRNLEAAIADKSFREDLYYRLNVVSVYLPPLRSRRDDIPSLVEHFLDTIAANQHLPRPKLAPETLKLLIGYPWPGNIRELENAIEHAMVMGNREVILPEDLPLPIQSGLPRSTGSLTPQTTAGTLSLEDMEKQMLIEALNQTGHNQSRAAEVLGITRRTLGYRMKKYGIE